jgi:hypothetical protein
LYVMFDFYSQKGPEGDLILCKIPFVLSIVCFKPFTLPMWACITVTTQYSFTELMFGSHPRGRDVTGTTVHSPLTRNILSIILIVIISILFFLWMLCALVFYTYPMIVFSPILIIPSVIFPVVAIVVPMVIFDFCFRKVRGFLFDSRRTINIQHAKKIREARAAEGGGGSDDDEEGDEEGGGSYLDGGVGGDVQEDLIAKMKKEKMSRMSGEVEIVNVINPKIRETSRLLRIASIEIIMILCIALPLIQFYHYESFTYLDGADALLANINYGIDQFMYNVDINFGVWPAFNNFKRYEICFIIGIAIMVVEYFFFFGLSFIRWFHSLPLFFLTKPRDNATACQLERYMSMMYGSVFWYPFSATLNIVRTGLEISYQQWQIEILDSIREDTIEDPNGVSPLYIYIYIYIYTCIESSYF